MSSHITVINMLSSRVVLCYHFQNKITFNSKFLLIAGGMRPFYWCSSVHPHTNVCCSLSVVVDWTLVWPDVSRRFHAQVSTYCECTSALSLSWLCLCVFMSQWLLGIFDIYFKYCNILFWRSSPTIFTLDTIQNTRREFLRNVFD